jgi:hypothetical protein
MARVKMNAKHEYEYIANFKILQTFFKNKKIDKVCSSSSHSCPVSTRHLHSTFRSHVTYSLPSFVIYLCLTLPLFYHLPHPGILVKLIILSAHSHRQAREMQDAVRPCPFRGRVSVSRTVFIETTSSSCSGSSASGNPTTPAHRTTRSHGGRVHPQNRRRPWRRFVRPARARHPRSVVVHPSVVRHLSEAGDLEVQRQRRRSQRCTRRFVS